MQVKFLQVKSVGFEDEKVTSNLVTNIDIDVPEYLVSQLKKLQLPKATRIAPTERYGANILKTLGTKGTGCKTWNRMITLSRCTF